MKKLPELYKNTNISLTNNKKYCYVEEQTNNQSIEEIQNKIKNIIHETNSNQVIIKTKDNEYKTIIVAKVNNNIITLNNDKIPINEIISIEII